MGKRTFDVVFSACGLLVLCPFLLFLIFFLYLFSGRPIFFTQTRVGLHQAPFKIIKFRTMHVGATGPVITVGQDQRVTRMGSFLRKYKLDELPQLVNVLKGEMSFVGPRPCSFWQMESYSAENREKLFSVSPGITDLASVRYFNESDLLGLSQDPEHFYLSHLLPKKMRYYKFYVQKRNLCLDIKIIWMTIKVLFFSAKN